jgi:hypothetical protein
MYGPLRNNPHLDFCCELNRVMLDALKPRGVVVTGLGCEALVADKFGLKKISTVRDDGSGKRLVENYVEERGRRRLWFVIPHLSGARGFTDVQRGQIRTHIRGSVPMAASEVPPIDKNGHAHNMCT